jgi:murein DD-endopeptidase MepM/ murein hydrolase activator NlpD
MREHRLLRSVPKQWPIGAKFLQWGKSWHAYFDETGNWVKGQRCANCGLGIRIGQVGACSCEHPAGEGQHTGLDVICPKLEPVVAPCDGRISWAQFGPMLGNCVKIEMDRPVINHLGLDCLPTVALAHFDSFADGISEGKFVYRGTLLGRSGATGNASGPHVHVQMTEPNGRPMRIEFYDLDDGKGVV